MPLPKPQYKTDRWRLLVSILTGDASINADATGEQLYGLNPLVASAKAGSASYLEDIVFFSQSFLAMYNGDNVRSYSGVADRSCLRQ